MLAELMRAQRIALLRADGKRRLRVLKSAFAQWKGVNEETKRRTEVRATHLELVSLPSHATCWLGVLTSAIVSLFGRDWQPA
jgi:hypothetical protein